MKQAAKALTLLLALLLLLCACAPAEDGGAGQGAQPERQETGQQPGQPPAEERQTEKAPGQPSAEQKPDGQQAPDGQGTPDGQQAPDGQRPERAEKPAPPSAEQKPDGGKAPEAQPTVTLSIRCDTVLENLGDLDPDKADLVPQDGVILAGTEVLFSEGESVFDALARAVKAAGVHMEYSRTPLYQSSYIEGIGNLYELDCGPLSGWMYRVNGAFPNYGCSKCALADGDVIEWVYTCDLGADVGGSDAFEGQQG